MQLQTLGRAAFSRIIPRTLAIVTASADTPASVGLIVPTDLTYAESPTGHFLVTLTVAAAVVTSGSVVVGDKVDLYDDAYSRLGNVVTAVRATEIDVFVGQTEPVFAFTGYKLFLANLYQRVLLVGKKAAKTNNTGIARLGFKDGENAQISTYPMPITLAAGAAYEYVAPNDSVFKPRDLYYQVDTANDGVMAIFS